MEAEKPKEELICIPCGGLNDSLATIGICFDLCLREQNFTQLTICDEFSDGLMGQLKNIFDFYTQTFKDSKNKIKRIARIRKKLTCPKVNFASHIYFLKLAQELDSKPNTLQWRNKIDKFYDLKKWMAENSIYMNSIKRLSSTKSIYIGYAGGPPSRELLRSIALKQEGRIIMNSFNQKLPSNYNAIHIRNTDMKTDYESAFNGAKKTWNDGLPIMICSDDKTMQEKAMKYFGSSKIIDRNHLFKQLLAFKHKPNYLNSDRTHDPSIYQSEDDRKTFVLRSIVDLFLMAQSKKLFFSTVRESYSSTSNKPATSGFALLAEMLKADASLMNRRKLSI